MFDKRGTGLSDPVRDRPSLDLRMDDVRAVLDAAGSDDERLLPSLALLETPVIGGRAIFQREAD